MHNLESLFRQKVSSGLSRSSVKRCSQWACKYRYMGKPFPGVWTFDHHPWLRELHDDDSEHVVVQKAAQMGFTEWVLNTAFYYIDNHGESVLYVLPTDNDASDFSASRFDPALQLSDHLRNLFSDVQNVGHKRAGSANLFVRGSRSKSQLKSIPAGVLIFDEIDEMVQSNVPLALERASGQLKKIIRMLSTATIPGHGINAYYQDSTQSSFFFKCPHCGKLITLTLENLIVTADSLTDPGIRDSHLVCGLCKNTLHHAAKSTYLRNGIYVPEHIDRDIKGYYVNQLYSPTVTPVDIAKSVIKARSNPAEEQELYNSKLGLCHTVEGAKITDQAIIDCTAHHVKSQSRTTPKPLTLGIDVGKWLHCVVYEWSFDTDIVGDLSTQGRPRLLQETKVLNFEDLDKLMHEFRINAGVIDANPESRKSLEFCQRFPGLVYRCYYGNAVHGRHVSYNDDLLAVTVDRTSWLDLTLGRFHQRHIRLPVDLSLEYKEQAKAPVRIYKKDSQGNPIATYVKAEKDDDHFAHASNYAEIALAVMQVGNTNMQSY